MRIKLMLVLLAAGGLAQVASAQSPSGAGYYNYAEIGDVTVRVKVWGSVRPGLYEVKQGTNLSTLLTLAGGPPIAGVSERGWKKVNIQVVREQDGEKKAVYQFEMDDGIQPLQDDPVLRDNDMITVETLSGQRFGWRDLFTGVAAIGSLALLTLRIWERVD